MFIKSEKLDARREKMMSKAEELAKDLGATHAYIIAFYSDPEGNLILDAGQSPLPPEQLFVSLAAGYQHAHAAVLAMEQAGVAPAPAEERKKMQ